MRFFKSFRLLHRRTKSEGDVTAVLTAQSATQTACRSFSVQRPDPPNMTGESDSFSVDTINLTPPINELPFFDPIDLYAPLPYVTSHFFPLSTDSNIAKLEAKLATLQEENQALQADLIEITKEAA